MSRYRQGTSVPWIAAAVLLVAFVAIVVWATSGESEQASTPPVASRAPAPAPPPGEPETPPVAANRPSPKPRLTAAEAERRLRQATTAWRAFALELCEEQKWPSARALVFLEKATWNDRDLEKQHAHGIASIRTMLGVKADDPITLAEALGTEESLRAFFETNWSKVKVEWEPEPIEKERVLEDAWKPNRIRWGFPLDAPIDDLQRFKLVELRAAQEAWQMLVADYLQEQKLDDNAAQEKWLAVVGDGLHSEEAKMHAAFRVLLDMPEGTVKAVVEDFLRRVEDEKENLAKSLLDKMDAALQAAEKAG